jgi:hypothetical protein
MYTSRRCCRLNTKPRKKDDLVQDACKNVGMDNWKWKLLAVIDLIPKTRHAVTKVGDGVVMSDYINAKMGQGDWANDTDADKSPGPL